MNHAVLEGARAAQAGAGTRVLKSVCRSCHGGCGTLLHVRDGELIKVEGDPDSPLNRGRLCPIGTVTRDLVYHPDRLKYPMRRRGKRGSGEWDRISWDEALDEISERLLAIRAQYGAESIALGTGTGRHHIRWVSRFGNALGTPNWCEPGFAQCFHPRVNTCILTMGDYPVCDFTGDTPAQCILYWGHNPVNSGPDGETRFNVRDSLAAARHVIVVDPRETELAKRADLWLQLRPGTDDALGLAMLNVIIGEKLYDEPFVREWTHGFDELARHVAQYTPEWAEPITWVAADKIRAAARLFARTKPALLEWGCAIEHTPKCIQTIRALSMLPVLTNNIEVPGGWVFGMHGIGRFPSLIEMLSPEANARRLGADRFKMLAGEGADLPAAHIPTLLQAMREGKPYPVKAFLVFGNNTLTTYANSALVYESLMKLDFMVNADLFMTPTAELADIVLPAASWPELDQIAGLPTIAANVVLGQQRAVRVHECKADEEIFVELARRMKLDGCTEPVREVLDSQLKGLGLTFQELTERGFVNIPIQYKKYEEKGFRTPTGKIELYSTRMEQMGYAPLPYYEEPPESPLSAPEVASEYPLVLTTGGRIPFFFNSEHRQIERVRKARREPRAEIHPDTAAALGIADGDWMWVETRRGRMKQRAKLTTGIDPRVINAEHAWWFPEEDGPEYGVWKSNVNLLTDNQPPYDPAMGTYQLRALLCRVGKAD
ncbi:molybdopterin-dependent oxidoreductase [Thauera chlorobenzoica]|uniref:Acetylene hydratase-like molybdopterin oxidoreductase n=1 Tax=Thauera chlorobenzoica TaxID=96773 RepID=A0A1H5XWK9_9RHOO|nr:molybdopterin-dependent oxidoreductase [Thauera chlorobenzoica]APR04333.1 acetylene hydratase-like molybdopterin oxidoreductase [Thauera chlorobenzoica]SEG16033.1 Anaerobic selenocysteine-containing dehydrogenase [Thauera chlorobenzoica]